MDSEEQAALINPADSGSLFIFEFETNSRLDAHVLYERMFNETMLNLNQMIIRGPLYNLALALNLSGPEGVHSLFFMSSAIVPDFGPAILIEVANFVVWVQANNLPDTLQELNAFAGLLAESMTE